MDNFISEQLRKFNAKFGHQPVTALGAQSTAKAPTPKAKIIQPSLPQTLPGKPVAIFTQLEIDQSEDSIAKDNTIADDMTESTESSTSSEDSLEKYLMHYREQKQPTHQPTQQPTTYQPQSLSTEKRLVMETETLSNL